MKSKLLKVSTILMIVAATGLADFPLDLIGRIKCC